MDTIPPKALTKLHHILKELHRVAKKCKVFETQKAIKKVRTFTEKVAQAEQSSDIPEPVKDSRAKELKKAERDLSLIKDLDINTTCIPAFKAAIPTSRIQPSFHQELLTACDSAAQKLSEASAAAPESITSTNSAEPQQQQQLTDLDRISKRLQDAKEFKKAVADGLAELVKLVGGGGGGGVVSSGEVEAGSKKRARGQGESNGDAGVGKKQKSGAAAGPGRYVLRPTDNAEKDGTVDDDDAEEAGDEMDDDEAFDSDPEHYVPPSSQNRPSKASPVSAPASKKAKKEPASSKKGQRIESSFVTSLNDGLSDVSLSDLEVDEKGRLKGGKKDDKKKKNRMGQRARQELYERQFGKQANHVIKRQVEVIKHKAKAAPAVVDEKVHPSWAAKRAQKQTITAFAGNKIVFGGEGNSSAQSASAVASGAGAVPAETLHPSWAAKRMQSAKILDAPAGKKIVFGDAGGSGSKSEASKEDGEKLHPSWAAKKKQSAAIGSAAGKKTVFGDEGGSKSSPKAAPVVEENLHPSWAAKKKQSAAIGGATGKKITFGDD